MKQITTTTTDMEVRQLLLDLLADHHDTTDRMRNYLAYKVMALFDTGMILREGQDRPETFFFEAKTDDMFKDDLLEFAEIEDYEILDAFIEARAFEEYEDADDYLRELGTEYFGAYDDMGLFVGDYFDDFDEEAETFGEYMIRTTQQLNRDRKINELI